MDKSLLDSVVRRGIVEHLSAVTGRRQTARELAAVVGVHTSTARFHLDQLVAAKTLGTGYERRGVGRPRKIYFIPETTPEQDVHQHNQSLQLLSQLLIDMLASGENSSSITPEEAGEKWAREHIDAHPNHTPATTPGEWLSKLGGLTDVLHDWGYTPQISTTGDRDKANIRLTHCPFRDLARTNPTVVCGIHRGLMRGAMAELGETDTDVTLLPFDEGDTCVAHLHRNSQQSSPTANSQHKHKGEGATR